LESAEPPIITRASRQRKLPEKKLCRSFVSQKNDIAFSKKLCRSFAKQKNDTVFFLAVSDAQHARVTMGDSADSDADDPLFRETGADMSRWLSRRDADEVGPDLAPVPVGLTRRKNCVILLRSKRMTQFFFLAVSDANADTRA